jgi:hypothetical protein
MRARTLGLVVAVLAVAPNAVAADEAAPSNEPLERLHPAVGVNAGAVVASPRLGAGFDASLNVSIRKPLGSVIVSAGLQPHYERYAFGESALVSCTTADACGNSVAVSSQASANVFNLEIPLVLELPLKVIALHPFLGVSPSFGYARLTESRQTESPRGASREESVSHSFLTFAAFGGGAISFSDRTALLFRIGYRFAPTFDDVPGGSASLRGMLASLGVRVVL